MSIREKLDISAYFVVGPENTKGRPVAPIIKMLSRPGLLVCKFVQRQPLPVN